MIYPYQQSTFDGIRRAMAVHYYAQQLSIPIKPRTHTMVIGPTGTGKTHLSNLALKSANWGVYQINCSQWMVNGSRGENQTLSNLVEWIARQHIDRPLGVVMDEVDKVGNTTTDWYRNVQVEMMSLLDGHLQPGTYDLGGRDGDEIERKFKQLFIVSCGAFQDLEDGPQTGLGFIPEDKTTRNLDGLSKMLPREIVNRFSDKVLRLPKLGVEDYREIARVLYRSSAGDIRKVIKEVANGRIDSAMENGIGARFGEVLAAEIIERVIESQEAPAWVRPNEQVATQEVTEEIDPTDDLWDIPIGG